MNVVILLSLLILLLLVSCRSQYHVAGTFELGKRGIVKDTKQPRGVGPRMEII